MNYKLKNGYKVIYNPQNSMADKWGFVYEHRIIAAKMLNRNLLDSEVVHHKDENKLNNSPLNLMVFKTKADHTAYHHGNIAILDGDVYVCPNRQHKICGNYKKICPVCQKNICDSHAQMCRNCWNIETSKNIPSKETLQNDLITLNFTEIGKKYGVTGNAVKKWLKNYGLYQYQYHKIPNEAEFKNYIKQHSISEAVIKYDVSRDIIKRWANQVDVRPATKKIKCVETNEIFLSGMDLVRKLFPEAKSYKSVANKLFEAIKNHKKFNDMTFEYCYC